MNNNINNNSRCFPPPALRASSGRLPALLRRPGSRRAPLGSPEPQHGGRALLSRGGEREEKRENPGIMKDLHMLREQRA